MSNTLKRWLLITLLLLAFAIHYVTIARADEPSLVVYETLIYEASNQGIEGMAYVSKVIQNRAKERKLSCEDIVMQKWQFSCNNQCWRQIDTFGNMLCGIRGKCPHKHKYTSVELTNAKQAWQDAKKLKCKANLYCRVDCYPSWIYADSVEYIETVKDHKFYFERR